MSWSNGFNEKVTPDKITRKNIDSYVIKNKHGFRCLNKNELGLLCCFDFKTETDYKFWDMTGNNNHLMKHCKDLEKL